MKLFNPLVIGNLKTLRVRRQKSIAFAVIDALEQRMLLSATSTLTAIAGFNGVNGYSPNSGVADANGDIFGATLATTPDGGNTFGAGVVYEIPAGTSTIKDLATFPAGASGTVGAIDASGDIFGVEAGATANVPDTVFEIPAGTSTFTPLATFATQTFGNQGTVTAVDSAGDVFGSGPFEIVKGSGVMTAVENPNGPQVPIAPQLGPGGNLYGIGHDQNGNSVIAEVSPTTSNVTTLATIDPTTIGTFPAGMTFDPSGNIWGLCGYGGPGGMGSIWELPAGSNTVSLIGSFTAATGDTPVGPPVFDASGNLFGLTTNDGANGDGTVFAIPAGKASAGPVDVVDLTSTEQVSTSAGFVTNSAGIAPSIDGGTLAIFGGLFGAPPTASAATGHLTHSADSPDFLGALFDLFYLNPPAPVGKRTPPPTTPFQDLEDSLNQENMAFKNDSRASRSLQEDQARFLINRNALEPAVVRATPQAKLSAPLEQIQQMLTTCGKELKAVAPLVKKQTSLTTQFNKEGTTITGLETKLAAQTKSSAKAKIQKTITADTAAQTKVLNQDYSVYNTAITKLSPIGSLENTIQTALNALPS